MIVFFIAGLLFSVALRINALTGEVKFYFKWTVTNQELLRALIEILPRPRGFGPLQAGSRRLSQGPGSAINSLRHREVALTRRSLAECRIARISSSTSLVLSNGNSTEAGHSLSRSEHDVRKKGGSRRAAFS